MIGRILILLVIVLLGLQIDLYSQTEPNAKIDHIIFTVENLQSAIVFLEDSVGFTIKPGRRHENSIRNAHIKFEQGPDIELITADSCMDDLSCRYFQNSLKGGQFEYISVEAENLDKMVFMLRESQFPARITSNSYSRILDFEADEMSDIFFIFLKYPAHNDSLFVKHAIGAEHFSEISLNHLFSNSTTSLLSMISNNDSNDKFRFGDFSIGSCEESEQISKSTLHFQVQSFDDLKASLKQRLSTFTLHQESNGKECLVIKSPSIPFDLRFSE